VFCGFKTYNFKGMVHLKSKILSSYYDSFSSGRHKIKYFKKMSNFLSKQGKSLGSKTILDWTPLTFTVDIFQIKIRMRFYKWSET